MYALTILFAQFEQPYSKFLIAALYPDVLFSEYYDGSLSVQYQSSMSVELHVVERPYTRSLVIKNFADT